MTTATKWKDLWACPLMTLRAFAEVMDIPLAATKKFLAAAGAPILTVGGVDWVQPQNIAHASRGWKAEAANEDR